MAPVHDGAGDAIPPVPARPLSALPSVQARVLAFAAIAVAGVFGGLIGFSTVKVGCHQDCSTPEGIGGVVGAVIAALGVAVIAVLVLRAMGEWRTIEQDRASEALTAAAAAFRRSPRVTAPASSDTESLPQPPEPELPTPPADPTPQPDPAPPPDPS